MQFSSILYLFLKSHLKSFLKITQIKLKSFFGFVNVLPSKKILTLIMDLSVINATFSIDFSILDVSGSDSKLLMVQGLVDIVPESIVVQVY